MQESRSDVRAGERVRLRGVEWMVLDVAAHHDCHVLTVEESVEGTGVKSFLLPFDRPLRLRRRARVLVVRPRRWLRALASLAATATPADGLRAAASARLELRSFQLEPAMAVVLGLASRVLLADDVGLGKTIQAGLVLAELRARGRSPRALIVTPSALCDQWKEELERRFSLDAEVVDPEALRRRHHSLPRAANPWSLPGIAIVSIDYVKRPETLNALADIVWDVLIVDEAHCASSESARGRAMHALGRRARVVLLLTATPHSGDDAAYGWLAGLGGLSRMEGVDPILMFRRRRADVGMASSRRSRLLFVCPTADERRMHDLLDGYTRTVWRAATPGNRAGALLAMIVLKKRALSSASSLVRSVARRLALLAQPPDAGHQLGLPFGTEEDADGEPDLVLSAPGLEDGARERAWLGAVGEAARNAAHCESKMAALVRLARRTHEPIIVFTEYRDTLAEVARKLALVAEVVTLDGRMTRAERQEAISKFTTGAARILVTTDVGAEGLNLHARCRFVASVELPWIPARLQQRMGRVDRIGQRATVHGLHLVGRQTSEDDVLARIVMRLGRVTSVLGESDQLLGHWDPRALEIAMMTGAPAAGAFVHGPAPTPPSVRRVDLRATAHREETRLRHVRALTGHHDAQDHRPRQMLGLDLERRGPWITTLRRPPSIGQRPRERSAAVALALTAGRIADGRGRTAECAMVPMLMRLSWVTTERPDITVVRRVAQHIVRQCESELLRTAGSIITARCAEIRAAHETSVDRQLVREAALADHLEAGLVRQVQPGLFDRRALDSLDRHNQRLDACRSELADHVASLHRSRALRLAGKPELLLLALLV